MWRRLIAEGLGTFLFTLSISTSHYGVFDVPGTYYSAYAVAGSIVSIMMLTGYISGSNFNPAITIGHLVTQLISVKINKDDIIEHLLYIIVQMIFAIPAAYIGYGINRGTMYFDTPIDATSANAFFCRTCVFDSDSRSSFNDRKLKWLDHHRDYWSGFSLFWRSFSGRAYIRWVL